MAAINPPGLDGWTLNNNALSRTLDADPMRTFSVEIGDSKQPLDAFPQLKLLHWDNEANFSLRLDDADPAGGTATAGAGVFEWARDGRTARIYETTVDGEAIESAFEFEVEFAAKPASNVLAFTIEAKGLKFIHQGALTPAEIAEGHIRPDNVIGSYAVFHATNTGNYINRHYRAGKAFHIYRPHAMDSDGVETWCDLDVNAGVLTVTVPQAFLDSATYPVVVDPTFGKTDIGGSNFTDTSDSTAGSSAVPASSGDVSKITLYSAGSGGTRSVTCGLYESGGVDDPTDKLGETAEDTNVTTTPAWRDFAFSVEPAVIGSTDYFNVWTAEANHTFYYDTAGGSSNFSANITYPHLPDPMTGAIGRDSVRSIYATFPTAAVTGIEILRRRIEGHA